MLKTLLKVIVVASGTILCLCLVEGLQRASSGNRDILFLAVLGLLLWIPFTFIIVRYINEEDKKE